MNKQLANSYLFGHSTYRRCLIIFVLLTCATHTNAQNPHVLLVPESTDPQFEQAYTSANKIPKTYSSLEKGLSLSLGRSVDVVIEKERLFESCSHYLCGEKDINSLLQTVSVKAPEVNLLVLYSYGGAGMSTLYVRLIDPLSYKVLFSDNLSLIEEPTTASLLTLGQDMGKLIDAKVDELPRLSEFSLKFEGFLPTELDGLSSWVLANSTNTRLVLTKSSVNYQLFEQFLALNNSQFILFTTLNATQVKQLLKTFFDQQSLTTMIFFDREDLQHERFKVVRKGNPYLHTLLFTVILCIGIVMLSVWYFRRRYLASKLEEYANKRNADAWLRIHKKASFALYGIHSKCLSEASYWMRLQKESNDIASQAKTYYEAGDIHTAKLFVAKALHSNAANTAAHALQIVIEEALDGERTLLDNERSIKDELAQAMYNYRQKKAIVALQGLYKAVALSQKQSSGNKQTKALTKLIEQIKQEFSSNEHALVVSCSQHPQRIVLCQNELVHIGRRSNNEDIAWISPHDNVFYINQKFVSRAGQQCFIKRQENGWFLVDSASKNGTFINRNKLIAQQPTKLNNADTIHLGGNISLLSPELKVVVRPNESIVEFSIDMQSMSLVNRQKLNSDWPDNTNAARTTLICLARECCLVINKVMQTIQVVEISELPSMTQNEQKQDLVAGAHSWAPLCIVKLGKNASIRPIHASKKEHDVLLDSMPILGEVPLIFPCSLEYEKISIQLNAYDSAIIDTTPGSSMAAPSIRGNP